MRRVASAAIVHQIRVQSQFLIVVALLCDAHAPTNIIHGAFTSAKTLEWAILCSAHDTSQILIYRDPISGDARLLDSLQRAADIGWMQRIGDARWSFSRLLRTLPERQARAVRLVRHPDERPPEPRAGGTVSGLRVCWCIR